MFDTDRSTELNGRVREFQWSNPHCFIQLIVTDGTKEEEWSIEMGNPATVARSGWGRSSIRAGDRITVVVHPLRDGGSGGSLVSARNAAGVTIGARSAK
jgi:hypothetical protein